MSVVASAAGKPERASEAVKVTVTAPLFQPFALAAGVRVIVPSTGAVLSMLTAGDV